ncbi:RsmE family RNA methyltransferase [Alphaproteobacteria bacterium endosymbiont of Tiliacea citrago]|uniref:16S rRNA (uracil(1498)-N(3))-methyltransferase n=1 Tax=Alphaproteobacteria bacterium endosymbiont of Tiliacea citrago TaxID=3077944 RepID=UPI00313C1A8B
MKRIYIKNINQKELKIDEDNLKYLTKTLRFKGEEEIKVFDGEKEYAAYYENKKIIIKNEIKEKEKAFLKIAIAEIQKERLEWIIEKGTELGVKDFFILKTKRTQKQYKIERMNNIIISACQQSGRISVPTMQQINLLDFLKKENKKEWCYCSLKESAKQIEQSINGAIIGPEGGWTEEEEKTLNTNYQAISLNANTLRSETAAITALNFILYAKSTIYLNL